jgi:DNA-binding NtrC family response regulator
MRKLRRGSVLVVDDEPGMRHILKRVLTDEGYTVGTASDGNAAIKIIGQDAPDAVMLDIRMPGKSGLEILDHIKQENPDTAVIMMTAFGTVETAVKAMKRGAYEYITKPFNNDEVLHIINNALERKRLLDRTRYLAEQLEEQQGIDNIIGESHPMQELFSLIRKVAPTDSTVLILGGSGTGKELVARAIHSHSNRKDENFLAINCGALPKDLIESELFGHEKGSFSGAYQRKIGLFESADGGTLFLDEIGELPMELQVKLLRALEQREIRRLGSVSNKPVDVRVVAATNKDLKENVQDGLFREDLYYRLSIIDINLPYLRDRKEDIPQLVEHFITVFNQKMNRSVVSISPEAMKLLMNYSWPGNVRELENMIQRGMVLRESGVIEEGDLPEAINAPAPENKSIAFIDPSELTFQKAREAFEHQYLEQLIKANGGNVTKSAIMAGISRRHLQELMKKYNLRTIDLGD